MLELKKSNSKSNKISYSGLNFDNTEHDLVMQAYQLLHNDSSNKEINFKNIYIFVIENFFWTNKTHRNVHEKKNNQNEIDLSTK